SGPDHVNADYVGSGGALLEELAPHRELIERAIRTWKAFDLNPCLAGEVLQIMSKSRVHSGGIPFHIKKGYGDRLRRGTPTTAEAPQKQRNAYDRGDLDETRPLGWKSQEAANRRYVHFQFSSQLRQSA